MSGLQKFLIAVLLSSLLLTASPRPALACSCVFLTPQRALAYADTVFTGQAIEHVSIGGPFSFEDAFTFRVYEVWKGLPATKFTVNSTDQGMCGYRFQPDGEYLVYAYKGKNGLSASICSRTRPMAQGQEDFAVLGTGTPIPVSVADTSDSKPSHTTSPLSLIALGALLFSPFGFALLMHFRRYKGMA